MAALEEIAAACVAVPYPIGRKRSASSFAPVAVGLLTSSKIGYREIP